MHQWKVCREWGRKKRGSIKHLLSFFYFFNLMILMLCSICILMLSKCLNTYTQKKYTVLDFFSLISTDGADKSCALIFLLEYLISCLLRNGTWSSRDIIFWVNTRTKINRWGVWIFDVDVVTWKPIQMFQYQCKIPWKLA